MYALWRPAEPSGPSPTMQATLHGLNLRVEPVAVHRWHWRVATAAGIELEAGEASTLMAAEGEAEREVLAVHVPGSSWVERCQD